jgi:hypothetical protein
MTTTKSPDYFPAAACTRASYSIRRYEAEEEISKELTNYFKKRVRKRSSQTHAQSLLGDRGEDPSEKRNARIARITGFGK